MKIFYNANIYNNNNNAFVEDKGKIIFVGDNEDAFNLFIQDLMILICTWLIMVNF